MNTLHVLRALRVSCALGLAALVFGAHPGGGGVAHARTWTAHGTHFAPPSTGRHGVGIGPFRPHGATGGMALHRVSTSPMGVPGMSGTHRPGIGRGMTMGLPPSVHFTEQARFSRFSRLSIEAHYIDGRPHVVVPRGTPQARPLGSASVRGNRFGVHMGALGPINAHPTQRPPTPSHPQQRLPFGPGRHPLPSEVAPHPWMPPSVQQHHAGRR